MLKENICEKRPKSKLKSNERKMRRCDKNDDKLTLNDCNRKKKIVILHFCFLVKKKRKKTWLT